MTMKANVRMLLIVSIFLLVIGSAASAKTIYVDADVSGGGGGTNWADAYNYLQDALADADASAKPVEIRVAQGAYKPDQGATPGDREESFNMISEVTIKGGYAGYGEVNPDALDITAYETILSGDLSNNDVSSVLDPCDLLDEPTRAENSYHVVRAANSNPIAVLDGFTISGGNANHALLPHNSGAGIRCSSGGMPIVYIYNCTFKANSARKYGGGISSMGGSSDYPPTVVNCRFIENYSTSAGGGLYSNNLTAINCVFLGNNSGLDGGGAHNNGGRPVLTDCIFISNRAIAAGGGLNFLSVAGMNDTVKLTNCVFIGNIADERGGGIYTTYLTDAGVAELTNCTFSGNVAKRGGAYASSHDFSEFTNCTFSDNQATEYGGAFYWSGNDGTPILTNCILWGNTAGLEGPQVANFSSTLTVSYCNVQGGELDVYLPLSGTLTWGSGNIDVDPLFVDADGADNTAGTDDDDLHLRWSSPCINTGDPNIIFNINERDIDDEPRVMVSRVDMGADEVGEKQGDFTRNGTIDVEDFGVFCQTWLSSPAGEGWYLLCDLYEDNQIDALDLEDFSGDWLWQASWY